MIELREEWERKYDSSLREHLEFFREAANGIGVPMAQVDAHDQSKTSPMEYPAYVRKYGGGIYDPDDFDQAWLHHIRNNPHHWQHWVIPGGCGEIGTPVRMPRIYVVEMVVDWMGSNRAYTGNWDMTDWLRDHCGKMIFHEETTAVLGEILDGLGYKRWFGVWCGPSCLEGE
jgi:hypothetical protein